MRALVILAAVIAIALAGLVGFIVVKERQRGATTPGSGSSATDAAVATITRGSEVDIAAHVPGAGHTVVMFTADF